MQRATPTPASTGAATAVALFAAAALVGCLAARFPPFAEALPPAASDAAFIVAGCALGATGAAEAHLPRGTVGPTWMRVRAAPRLAMALGVSFGTTVIAQLLGISLGPVDPTFPAGAPPGVNTLWFFVFTLGFVGIGMMSAPSLLLPVLHPPARWLRRLALPLGVAILGGVFGALGAAFRTALTAPAVIELVAAGKAFCEANSQLVTAALLIATLAPLIFPGRPTDAGEDDDDA
ncbi:hypothetical protein L6V77_31665 [Myxococcota bacterium]|nr:hypothetical protein [Myxococcota bacterium]